MLGRRVTEDDGPALQNRKFLKSHPDSEIPRTFVFAAVPLVQVCGSRVRQNVWPAVYRQLYVERQLVQIFEDLLPNSLLYALQMVVRDLASVSIPQSLFAFIVGSRAVLIRRGRVIKRVHHHQFVVAQKHVGIWHRHDPAEDPDAVRIPIDHVAEDIERVLSPQADLPHDRIKPPLLPMDIRHDIDHGVSPPSSQHK